MAVFDAVGSFVSGLANVTADQLVVALVVLYLVVVIFDKARDMMENK